jgi:hypothetical protein
MLRSDPSTNTITINGNLIDTLARVGEGVCSFSEHEEITAEEVIPFIS